MVIDFRNLRVISLGEGLADKLRVAALFIYLKIRKIFTGYDGFKKTKELRLSFEGKPFVFHVSRLLDFHLLREMFIDEQYADARQVQPSPEDVLDLGSNIGASVIYFKLLFPTAKVLAVEPNPGCQELLLKNVAQFGESVKVKLVAIGGREGEADFHPNKEHWSSSLLERRGAMPPVKVPVRTIGGLCSEEGLTRVGLLKMDIEGAEFGLGETLASEPEIGYMLAELHPKLAGKEATEFLSILPKNADILRETPCGSHRHIFVKMKS